MLSFTNRLQGLNPNAYCKTGQLLANPRKYYAYLYRMRYNDLTSINKIANQWKS